MYLSALSAAGSSAVGPKLFLNPSGSMLLLISFILFKNMLRQIVTGQIRLKLYNENGEGSYTENIKHQGGDLKK